MKGFSAHVQNMTYWSLSIGLEHMISNTAYIICNLVLKARVTLIQRNLPLDEDNAGSENEFEWDGI